MHESAEEISAGTGSCLFFFPNGHLRELDLTRPCACAARHGKARAGLVGRRAVVA
jgi:hypothetical protein